MACSWRCLVLCAVGLLAAGCGASDPGADTSTVAAVLPAAARPAAPRAKTPFSTTVVPGLNTSPEDVYEQAKVVCAIKPARQVAADFGMHTSSHEPIVARYSRGYDAALVEAAATGCRRGLASYAAKHR